MTNEHEIAILNEKIDEHGVAGVAAYLSGFRPNKPINSAHVSNVESRGRIGPTLRRAMVAAGWIEPGEPYGWFKVKRDSPERAAELIVDRVERGDLTIDWLNRFVSELIVLASDDDEPIPYLDGVKRKRERVNLTAEPIVYMGNPVEPVRRRFGIRGSAEPVVIPGDPDE